MKRKDLTKTYTLNLGSENKKKYLGVRLNKHIWKNAEIVLSLTCGQL